MNTNARPFKDALYDQFARIGKAVANPHRLEILDILAQGERRVDEIAKETNLSFANTSQHLQALREGRLVEARRAGTAMHYRLADDRVFHLWQAIRELGEARLAEIDRLAETYLDGRDHGEAIDAATLAHRLGDDDVVVLDVRPVVEFLAGHIPGAHSIPVGELASRLRELPADREIIAYCRGPYCVFADEAVALLRERGFHAWRLDVGLPDWRSAGFPVRTGVEEQGSPA